MEHAEQVGEDDLLATAREVRGTVIDLSFNGRTPHLASALSCVDILVAAYWGGFHLLPEDWGAPDRDRLVLSKGHAAIALYAALAHRGYFPMSLLDTFAEPGSSLAEQPSPHCAPGVEAATGSLGHGLSFSAGMALACRLQGMSPRLLTVLSDGECNEGSVWEAAMFASANRLGNLTAVVDYNKWQATGRSDEILALAPLASKWRSFGWDTHEVDGHDVKQLRALMVNSGSDERPTAIIAHTVKGRGISFMEDDNNWHYRIPDADERSRARAELGLQ